MNIQQPILKQQASLGLYFLKEAVSEVLFKAQNERPLHSKEIKSRIGIPDTGEPYSRSTALIDGILFLLKKEARIEEIKKEGNGWKITEVGISQHKKHLFE